MPTGYVRCAHIFVSAIAFAAAFLFFAVHDDQR